MNKLAVNAPCTQGDWWYESDTQLGFIHINGDQSYSHVVIDLNTPKSSYHHWGRVVIVDGKRQFRPSEIAFGSQKSTMFGSDLKLIPALGPSQTDKAAVDALFAQTIHCTVSGTTQQLTLSNDHHQTQENNVLYQAFKPHHTFGYWPDNQSADISYLIIFPNNHYAYIYSDLEQITATKFEFGRLF
ncbi:hypothetical protein [Shewanella subflava]|uniref:DUF3298 domain-containing protein n=1 Tax=Shewanella subflava TaxID=2986476 RepID=A0ABT3I7Y9_9GAMM|nr:hypothetical protein [Shewanella subflava]MCW3172123.1 hypothetical protein [Shewanella subflava]